MKQQSPYKPPKSLRLEEKQVPIWKSILLTVASIVIGFFVIDMGSFIFDMVISNYFSINVLTADKEIITYNAILRLAFLSIFFVLAGYLCTKIAPKYRILHPIIVGCIIVAVQYSINSGYDIPLWHTITHIPLVFLCLMLGYYLAFRASNKQNNET